MTESQTGPFAASALQHEFKQEELFPIREVSRLTGINPVTLRAWERRYGLIQPTRTESGHRLYSQADIEEIRNILGWLERGVAVSKVSTILARASSVQLQSPVPTGDSLSGEWTEWQERVRRATASFDERRLEQIYGQVFSSYPMGVVFQDIFMPVWRELLLNQERFGQVSEWLLLDSFLRARTLQRLQLASSVAEHKVILAGVPGQCRELELWVAGLLLGSAELGVQVLAVGQPLEELTLVCDKVAPVAVVLFTNHPPAADLPRRLQRLVLALDCPLLLAGEGADLAQDSLEGSPVACIGSEGSYMQRRLLQFLAGHLDT